MPRRLPASLILPLAVPQALWVAARALRLPEPDGPRAGVTGDGPPFRLMLIGDSSAAGVGVATQGEALSGRLVSHLSATHRVCWSVHARSGATSASTLRAIDALPREHADAVVVCLGVNDAKNGVPRSAWRARMDRLVRLIAERTTPERLILSGLPPLARFPILPPPLSGVIGRRAAAFDADLIALARSHGAVHVPLDPAMDVSGLAPDGFHPGPHVYDGWAAHLAPHLLAR